MFSTRILRAYAQRGARGAPSWRRASYAGFFSRAAAACIRPRLSTDDKFRRRVTGIRPITAHTRRYKRHMWNVQHRFLPIRDGPLPLGAGPANLSRRLVSQDPVHEGATPTGERSTAEHYGQRRTSQTCFPKLPRCHGLWLFAPPPAWPPAAGRATGIRLLTHASSLQSWRTGVTD